MYLQTIYWQPANILETNVIFVFYGRCPLGSGRHRVKKLLAWLLDLPTFSSSPTRATKDIVVEGDKLEEVKTVSKAILEPGWVMPHSGFGATLNPDCLKKIDPPSLPQDFQTLQFFQEVGVDCGIKTSAELKNCLL